MTEAASRPVDTLCGTLFCVAMQQIEPSVIWLCRGYLPVWDWADSHVHGCGVLRKQHMCQAKCMLHATACAPYDRHVACMLVTSSHMPKNVPRVFMRVRFFVCRCTVRPMQPLRPSRQ
jgi:hypothetical protein